MLTVQQILKNKEYTIERLTIKNFDASLYIDHIEYLEKWRKEAQSILDDFRYQRTQLSEEIGKRKGKDCDTLKWHVKELKWWIDFYEKEVKEYTEKRDTLIIKFPNIPHESIN